MSSVTLYADTTSGKLSLTNTGSYQTSVTFTYDTSGGKATIMTFTPKTYAGALEIPSTLAGLNVTSVYNYTFQNCTGLTSVTFASGSQLLTIGGSVFAFCSSLTSITIPASVTSIGADAFYNCSKLSSITFASGSQLQSIENNAFRNCSSLKSITIPASVTSISTNAFLNCSSLTPVTFLGNVPTLGTNSFTNISPSANAYYISNTNNIDLVPYFKTRVTYTTSDSNATITEFLPKTYAGALEIPSTLGGFAVTSIGLSAFINCTGLTSVTFASGSQLLTIGGNAFSGCAGLTSIVIPASVTSIGGYVFDRCAVLTSVSIPASVTSIGSSTFSSCLKLDSVTFASGSQLTTISNGLFLGCTGLTSVNIPASVTTIVGGAFWGSGLTSITIPASVTSIGANAFNNCSNLKSVTFTHDSQLKTIANNAFSSCTGLTSIFIPDSVTSIGNDAFLTSGLITMYVSTINGLSLTPSVTPVTLYGKTFTIKDVAENPAIPICFPAGTKVTTDQGDIAIEKLNASVHTIRGKKIVTITKTIPLQKHIISIEKDALAKNVPSVTTQISKEHKLFYKGKMVKARDLVEVCQGVTAIPYNGEILYNVLLKKHDKMMINNLICETLHPENIMAKIYHGNFQTVEKNKIYEKLNHIIRTNDVPEYNKLYASLK